jgi:hypothetical protein
LRVFWWRKFYKRIVSLPQTSNPEVGSRSLYFNLLIGQTEWITAELGAVAPVHNTDFLVCGHQRKRFLFPISFLSQEFGHVLHTYLR